MKINWGTKLMFFAACFMGFVVFMVIRISQTDVPLVEEGYYEKGIKYQDQINISENTDAFTALNFAERKINVLNSKDSSSIQGSLKLYKPNNPKLDKEFAIDLKPLSIFEVDMSSYEKGKWKLSLNWTRDQIQYSTEKEIELK
ncbi:MAG: FixH family protein [Bacteroidia bacterium]